MLYAHIIAVRSTDPTGPAPLHEIKEVKLPLDEARVEIRKAAALGWTAFIDRTYLRAEGDEV